MNVADIVVGRTYKCIHNSIETTNKVKALIPHAKGKIVIYITAEDTSLRNQGYIEKEVGLYRFAQWAKEELSPVPAGLFKQTPED